MSKKFKTNKMYLRAIELSYQFENEKEIEAMDMTDMFYDEIIMIVKNGELLNININGDVASGKSTVGFALADYVMEHCYGRLLDVRDIDRDQEEYIETVKQAKVKNTVRVIDEWNDMEDTGENVTVEKALMKYMSDVQAQRNIQKISCSPAENPDKNARIYLEVIQADRQEKVTHCRLIYKFIRAGVAIPQIIGYVNVDVARVLDYVWYDEYRRRKFEKMDLILKEGIFRPREMKYAGIILDVSDSMMRMAKLGYLNVDMVMSNVEHAFRKRKLPFSIPGIQLSTKRAHGILSGWKVYFKLGRDIQNVERKIKLLPIGKKDEDLELKLETLKKELDIVLKQVQAQREGFVNMLNIKKKYDTVETEDINKKRGDEDDNDKNG